MNNKSNLLIILCAAGIFLSCLFAATHASAYSVSELKATYRSGQVFLTWKCPNTKKLEYKVYRSTIPITLSSQINSTTYLGDVRDSSSKNIRRSRLKQTNIYYKIDEAAAPLTPDRGLYVVTCTDNQLYYYAVTVTNLTTGKEVKTIISGQNNLLVPVAETVADPQPVLQDTVIWSTGEVANEYSMWGNNQNLPHYPAMMDEGSYGFNFNLIKRGQATQFPLYVFYEGLNATAIVGNGIEPFDDVTNCMIITVDDWLPDPNPNYSTLAGGGTFWCCYHEKFDIYSKTNPIPTSGTVRTYMQNVYIKTIDWAHKYQPTDTSRTYLIGLSAGGFGALLTAVLIPQKIAGVYVVVSPIRLKAVKGDFQKMWGAPPTNLATNIIDPSTGNTVLIWDLLDIKKMMRFDKNLSFPLIYSIHGKYDLTTGWSDKPAFYDSVQVLGMGGTYYWDQRQHDRTNANFLDSETMPDLNLFQTTKSYPAFSHCSVNQNPGNGTPSNGAPWGAINGYLTWDNDNITDEHCNYAINVSVKDFYVGGVLDANQYNTCFTDITFRRLQKFHPAAGDVIYWQNTDNNGNVIQSGSFTYTSGVFTIPGLQVNKSGNKISLGIAGCQRESVIGASYYPDEPQMAAIRTESGYELQVTMNHDEVTTLNLYDIVGQLMYQRKISLTKGDNSIQIPLTTAGTYIVELRGEKFEEGKKLVF